MIFAKNDSGRVTASPGLEAFCPSCDGRMVAKCGAIKVWHWAHVTGECDAWSEPESQWHLNWKLVAPAERCEVVMGNHRADIVAADGTVVELQHSFISADEIRERERFYHRMIWILDGSDFAERFSIRSMGSYCTFEWKWPRLSWANTRCPVLIDFGTNQLFEIRKFYSHSTPVHGWGKWGDVSTVESFIRGNRAATTNAS